MPGYCAGTYMGCMGIIGAAYAYGIGIYGCGGGIPYECIGCGCPCALGGPRGYPEESYDTCDLSSLYSLFERLRATYPPGSLRCRGTSYPLKESSRVNASADATLRLEDGTPLE